MNLQTQPARIPTRSGLTVAKHIFNLKNVDERRALDWIRRFHRPRGIHRLLDVRLSRWPGGTLSVFILTRCQARRAGARPEWMVSEYKSTPETLSVFWLNFPRLQNARAAFKSADQGFGSKPDRVGLQIPARMISA